MTSDPTQAESTPPDIHPINGENLIENSEPLQVDLREEGESILLNFPPENNSETNNIGLTWTEIWQQLKIRLNAGERFWQANTPVYLNAKDRLLDSRQLQEIAEALAEVELQLTQVNTSRRQTAVAAVTGGYSVQQTNQVTPLKDSLEPGKALPQPLYLELTVRSGVEIRHGGSVILIGDLNPGGSIVADGDILVWGRLRGLVHAGANGNPQRVIMALQMEPTLIRIAHYVARAPESHPPQVYPEVAYVTSEGIRISPSSDFDKSQVIG